MPLRGRRKIVQTCFDFLLSVLAADWTTRLLLSDWLLSADLLKQHAVHLTFLHGLITPVHFPPTVFLMQLSNSCNKGSKLRHTLLEKMTRAIYAAQCNYDMQSKRSPQKKRGPFLSLSHPYSTFGLNFEQEWPVAVQVALSSDHIQKNTLFLLLFFQICAILWAP